MLSLEELSKQCVAVCEVPISASKDSILSQVQRNLQNGRIIDSDEVDGIESDKNLTRLVLLLQTVEDVKCLCEEVREEEIRLGDVSFVVKYQRAIVCELPQRWEIAEVQEKLLNQSASSTQQNRQVPTPPRRSDRTKPFEGYPNQIPTAPYYGSGFYYNFPTDAADGGRLAQEGGNPYWGQGQMPQLEQVRGQRDDSGHGEENKAFIGQPDLEGQGHKSDQGQQMPNFEPGLLPHGFPGMWGMPGNAHPGMMHMPMMFPQPGQFCPMPGFPVPQPREADREPSERLQPQHPTGPPPPYNFRRFQNQAQDQAWPSQAVYDQADELQKLRGKINKEKEHERQEKEDEHIYDLPDDNARGQLETETDEKPTKILVSDLPSTAHEEFLEMFFENPKKSGGGPVVSVDYYEETASAIIEFEEPKVVENVLEKQPLKMMGREISVEVFDPEPVTLCTIEVTGPHDLVCEEQVEILHMYFEHRKSLGDEVKDIVFDGDVALVTFHSEEVASRVAQKSDHKINKKPISVKIHTPESKMRKPRLDRKDSERSADETNNKPDEEENEPVVTVKVKGVKELTSRDTLEYYFDNKRRSGGFDLQEIFSDEEDDDVLYVKYQNEEVARAVAEQSHQLEGVRLSVSLFTPPKPPPSYPDKILIKGLKSTTTEDGLFNFIEAKSGYIPVPGSMTFHAEQEGVVMVTLDREPDFEVLEKMCEKRLDDAKLKISKVPISNCIIVSDLAPDVTKDTVEFYFENTRKSNGGPVAKVVMNEDDTCFVYFEDYQVVDRVLEQQHELSKQKLEVKRYQECLGRPEGENGERKLNIPDALQVANIHTQKIKFLKNSKANHNALEKQMEACHTRILWSESPKYITLLCSLTKEVKDCYKLVKSWRKEAERNFEDFLNTIEVYQLSVPQSIWQKVMDQLKKVSIDNPEAVAVFVDKNEGCVTVAGNKVPAGNLKHDINSIIQKIMDEEEKEKQKVTDIINTLKPIQTKMLLADKFPTKMGDLFPDLKVKINQNKNEIIFEGSLGNVRDAKLKMFEAKDNFVMKSIENLPKLTAGLYKLKQTKEYIVKKLKTNSMIGVWEAQDQSLVVCSLSEDTIDQCVNIIRGSVIETSIGLTRASASVISSEQWGFKLEEWHSQYPGKAHVTVDNAVSMVQICSTDDINKDLLDGVKKFLRYNTVLEEDIPCSKNVKKLIEKNHTQDVYAICKELQSYHVNITFVGNGGFKVNGTEDGISKAKESLQKIFDKVKQKDHTISKPGLVEHIKTSRGRENLTTIENTMPCVIGVKGESNEGDTSENVYETIPADTGNSSIKVKARCKAYDSRNIYAVVGDMTEMSVQVLVNAADEKLSLSGGLAKAIASKGGKGVVQECADYIRMEGKLGDGEVFMCTGGNLKADHIIHVIGPVWKGGMMKEEDMLEEAVFKCMQQASIKNAKSIAIPAISCGAYGYPVKHATSTIVKAVKNFFREVQESSLTDVYLCDVKRNTVDKFTEALRTEFRDIKIESDSEEDEENYNTYDQIPVRSRLPPPPTSRPPRRAQMSDNQVNLGNITVKLTKGEIARETVDVIVNTTAKNLDLKNGAVSQSLLKAGGQSLQAELQANYPGGIKHGQLAVSGGHNLNCAQVYHTTLSNYDGANVSRCIQALQELMNNCLLEAHKQNHTSIAFPAIGTGNLGFPKDIVAKQMFTVVSKFSSANSGSSVKDVRFIVYQKDFSTIKAFEAELARCSSGGSKSRQSRKLSSDYEQTPSRKQDLDENPYESFGDNVAKPYENLKVVVKQGDITAEDADCIVNSSNEALDLTRGAVSKALLQKGGVALAREIQAKQNKMAKKQLVWTSAPGIPCKKIVHVVAQDSNKGWKSVIERCLEDADRKQLTSIAFPALGTGMQFEPKEMAAVMTHAIVEFDKSNPQYLNEIRIVVFQQSMVKEFQTVSAGLPKKPGFLKSVYKNITGIFTRSGGNDDYAEIYGAKKKTRTENCDTVTFVIVSMNNNVIEEAIKRLESSFEKEIHKKEFKDSILCRMDGNYIAEIEAIANQHHVEINTDVKSGRIEISGMAHNLMSASDKIHGIIRDAVASEKQRETAEIMSCLVQWFYIEVTAETGQTLEPYDKALNFKIETAFKSQESTFSFTTADGVKFIIDFRKMQEYEKDNPEDCVNVIRRDLLKESSSATPTSWGEFKGNLRVVTLQPTDKEYLDIEQKFQATAGTPRNVKQIQRIQNKTLWNQYHAKKKQLEDQNPPNTQNEHFLWHGTAEDAVDSINAHGFNRSYCGKNAVALGNGVYFAVQSAYSSQNTYSRPDANGFKRMYYSRVLTGEYIRGQHGMRVPPAKASGGSNAIYDSVVDNVNNPGIYVIFNDTQAYPEYLVTFSA